MSGKEKPVIVLNFNSNTLSETAQKQLQASSIINIPLEVSKKTDVAYYVDTLLDQLNLEQHIDQEGNYVVTYLIIPPGLSILSILVGRNLSDRLIPYNVVNLIRSPETGQFVVQDVY